MRILLEMGSTAQEIIQRREPDRNHQCFRLRLPDLAPGRRTQHARSRVFQGADKLPGKMTLLWRRRCPRAPTRRSA
mgnify:CR=1 FL=1